MSENGVSESPSERHSKERSDYQKEINARKDWNFELGVENDVDIPIIVIVGLQEKFGEIFKNILMKEFSDCQLPMLNVSIWKSKTL